jgi:hypothetical protein
MKKNLDNRMLKKSFLILILILNVLAFFTAGIIMVSNLRSPAGSAKEKAAIEKAKKKKVSEKIIEQPGTKEISEEPKSIPEETRKSEKQGIDSKEQKEAEESVVFTEASKIDENIARLNIASMPPGAKVYVNGYLKGITPVKLQLTSVDRTNNFKLVLLKPGYKRWEKDIELYKGEFKRYYAVMEKMEENADENENK